tara:strand:+ start:610 stop:888 length:279 start_codon:yes stop_codon:yes gene_type:complete
MTNEEIKEIVEGWNWNLNIFEIYDEMKETYTRDIDRHLLLNFAYEYFNHDKMMENLMDALCVEIEDQDNVRGYFKMEPCKEGLNYALEHMPL